MKRVIIFAISAVSLTISTYALQSHLYGVPDTFDMHLYLPLIRSWARGESGDFSSDLLLRGGELAPFVLYRAIAWAISAGLPEPFALEAVFFAGHALAFFACTAIARWFFGKTPSSMLCAAAMLLLPANFFSLHWNHFPAPAPISQTIGVPLAMLQLAGALYGRPLPALAAGILASLFHPGFTLMASCLSAAAIIGARKNIPVMLAFAAFLPAAACVLLASAGTNLEQIDKQAFFNRIFLFAHHLYPETHFQQGYGIFFVTAALSLIACRRAFPPSKYTGFAYCFAAAAILFLLSLINIQLQLSPQFVLLYSARSFVLVEPLAVCALAGGVTAALQRPGNKFSRMLFVIGAGICAAAYICTGIYRLESADAVFGPALMSGVTVLAAADLLHRATRRSVSIFFLLLLATFAAFGLNGHPELYCITVLISTAAALFLAVFQPAEEESRQSAFTFHPAVSARGLLLLSLCAAALIPLTKPHFVERMKVPCPPGCARLYEWIRSSTAAEDMLIARPDHTALALTLRLCTGRRLYISLAEINQLAYTPVLHSGGIERLKTLGMRYSKPRNDMTFSAIDFDSYESIALDTEAYGRLTPAKYIILERSRLNIKPAGRLIAFEDEDFFCIEDAAKQPIIGAAQ